MKGRPDKYILVDGQPRPCEDFEAWLRWRGESTQERRVKKTQIGKVHVATWFLGLDYNYDPDGPPLIYETVVSGGKLNQESWLSATKEEALVQHEEVVAKVQEAESTRH